MSEANAPTTQPPAPYDPSRIAQLVLAGAIVLIVGAFVTGALADPGSTASRWLPVAVGVAALVGALIRVVHVAQDRSAWSMLTMAIGVWTLGALADAVGLVGANAAGPTFADACHVAFYPIAYLGMVQLVRRRVTRFAAALWLDGLIGALAVGSVAAGIVLPPALQEAEEGDLGMIVLHLVYPLGDMLLLAFVAGVMALNGWRPGRAWVILGVAFGMLALAHAVELSEVAVGAATGGLVELLAPLAMILIAFAAWHPSELRPHIRLEGWSLLVAPTLFGWVTVALVGYGNFERLGPLGLTLAALTLVVIMVRAGLTFRENAVIARELREDVAQSAKDALTGLPNHRAFQEALQREISLARRHGRELSVVMFDIDDFRTINQIHGHQAGDEVLAEVAARIGATLRSEDVMARVGGEEFACLFPSTGARAAWRAAERARVAVEAEPFGDYGEVTVSGGVCDLGVAIDDDDLLRLADGALYWAKIHGRNVVYRYAPEVMDVLSAEDRAEQAERSRTLSAITALARAVDAKDATTQRHSERVGHVAATIAQVLGWTKERCAKLHEAGLVHDVGKIGVPDSILRKVGPLTAAENEIMKSHAALGAQIVQDVLSPEQALWVLHHHERWDGSGYPRGVSGESIPEGAQILAVADAWDAMTATRPYRIALDAEDVIGELRAGRGVQWSPRAIDAMLTLWDGGQLGPAGGGVQRPGAWALPAPDDEPQDALEAREAVSER